MTKFLSYGIIGPTKNDKNIQNMGLGLLEKEILESVVSFYSARLRDIKKSHEIVRCKNGTEEVSKRQLFINRQLRFPDADSQRGAIYARITETQLKEFEQLLFSFLEKEADKPKIDIEITDNRISTNLQKSIIAFGGLGDFLENDILNGIIFPTNMKSTIQPGVATCSYEDWRRDGKQYMFLAGYENAIEQLIQEESDSRILRENTEERKASLIEAAQRYRDYTKGTIPKWESWRNVNEIKVSYPKDGVKRNYEKEEDCIENLY